MDKQVVLNILKMTEQQILDEVSKLNLTLKEVEVLNKGREFIEKANEIGNKESIRRISLCLVAYELMKEKEVK